LVEDKEERELVDWGANASRAAAGRHGKIMRFVSSVLAELEKNLEKVEELFEE